MVLAKTYSCVNVESTKIVLQAEVVATVYVMMGIKGDEATFGWLVLTVKPQHEGTNNSFIFRRAAAVHCFVFGLIVCFLAPFGFSWDSRILAKFYISIERFNHSQMFKIGYLLE